MVTGGLYTKRKDQRMHQHPSSFPAGFDLESKKHHELGSFVKKLTFISRGKDLKFDDNIGL
jgi:hypothetical protein